MESFVRLKLMSSELTSRELDIYVGLQCDYSWGKGDLRKNTIIKEKNNGWVIESNLDHSDDINDHLNNILERVAGLANKISSLSQRVKILVSCAIYADDVPSLYFDKDTVKKIAALGADFDIDLYLEQPE